MKKITADKVRIKDIARIAGVSAGTVDRVIHNRGNVSPKKHELIKSLLKQFGYTPNTAAETLAVKSGMTFCAIIPNPQSSAYWELVIDGINKASREASDFPLHIEWYFFDQYDKDSFCDQIFNVMQSNPNGIILAPTFIEETILFASALKQNNIPCALIDSDISSMQCLTYYGQNSHTSGYVAAKLLFSGLPLNTTILLCHTLRSQGIRSNQAVLREQGFMQYVKDNGLKTKYRFVRLTLHPTDEQLNYSVLKDADSKKYPVRGALIFNSKAFRLSNDFEKIKLKNVKLIGYDNLPKNIQALQDGKIAFLIAQRPEMQGYFAATDLFHHLVLNQSVCRTNYMPIDIITKETAADYVQYYNKINGFKKQ